MDFIIYTIFSVLISTNALLQSKQDDVENITRCVVKILEEIDYKKYTSRIMDITVMNINNDLKLSTLHQVEGARFISRKFFWDTENISNVIYIVMSEDYLELADGLSKVTSDKFWNPSARFIIIVQNVTEYSLHNVTDLLHTYNIFHKVSVILRDGDDYSIYTYNFTKAGYCLKDNHLIFWLRCSDYTHSIDKLLLPVQKGTIRGCQYRLVTRNLWPLVNFHTDTEGTEQFFLSLFTKQYGVKIDLHEFKKVDRFGNPYDNETHILIKKVLDNEFEGVFGGYEINSVYSDSGNISHIYPMLMDHMYFILAHSHHVGQWVSVICKSFKTYLVVCLLFITLCTAATWLSIFRTRRDVFLNVLIVYGVLLNKYVVKGAPFGRPQVLIFSTILFTAFIIPYAIQADLFSATARPVRGFEPKKATELKNYQPVLYSEWQHRNKFDGHYDCGTRLNCLLTVRNCPNKSLYTVVSGCHYKVNQRYLTDNQCELMTYKLKEPYVSIYRTIYLRRGSALISPLNNFILRIMPTGILMKHSSDIYSREWFKCKSRDRPKKMALTLENFYNAFMILTGGYCLSLLSFIYEVWIGKMYRKHA